jgi:hypothetical protein
MAIVPPFIIKVLEFAIPISLLLIVLVFRIYDHSFRFKPRFNFEFSLLWLAVLLSMFAAYYFHKQQFMHTALSQRFIYFFLMYPLLHVLKPKPEELIRIVAYTGMVYAFLYIAQTVVYPNRLSTVNMFVDRNTLRIALPGSGFLFLGYLIGLSKFLKTNYIKYLLLCLLALGVFSLTGTRQVLAPLALITIAAVLFSRRVRSRILMIFMIGLALIPAYILFQDTFGLLLKVTHTETTYLSENKRFQAALFFLFEFFPNKMSYIIGNGVPSGHSAYGVQINAFKEVFGFYQSDIGIIGDLTRFGILIVVVQLSLYIRIMRMSLPPELDFVKYNVFAFLVAILFSTSFSYPDAIVILCILLYLVDVSSVYNLPPPAVPTNETQETHTVTESSQTDPLHP